MKKILFRTGMLPNETYEPEEYFNNNLFGGNVGNLLYTYGIIRNIVTGNDFELISNNYRYKTLDIDLINEEYSAFIIPLADAFRNDFTVELDKLTNLVKNLKIPCYVIGVGLRDNYEPAFKDIDFEFDENVKSFVSAVLEKSTIIGTRGQITSDYLSKLGFKEGRDHMPIGCPSMYTYGPNLHVEAPKIRKKSHISLNGTLNAPQCVLDFLERTSKVYRNYTFVPQQTKELKYVYTGIPFDTEEKLVPYRPDSDLFADNHVNFFLNIQSWFKYFDDIELSVGSRLHGNVAALLNNTPCIFMPKDARERELNDVHHFNSFPANTITEETTLKELIKKSDFSCFEKYQQDNYRNFLNFLDLNNIEHIDQSKSRSVPYDNYIKGIEFEPGVRSFRSVGHNAHGERLYRMYGEDFYKLNKKNK